MQKINWRKNDGSTNFVHSLDNEDNYISYNPSTNNGVFRMLAPLLGELEGEQEETALYYNLEWYILKGDFRKQIDECKTEEEIKEFFIEEHKTNGSGWSTFTVTKQIWTKEQS